jgi:ABC-type antimicrobial peptide transport system permease subunit
MAMLSGSFGILAAMLASIGLYGVTSYMVARRRNEIGIRIALGAARSNVMNMILRETAVLLAVGLAIGIVLTLAASRAAASMLYGLKPHDPMTILIAIAALAAVSLLAAYVPARHAASVDPMTALREE